MDLFLFFCACCECTTDKEADIGDIIDVWSDCVLLHRINVPQRTTDYEADFCDIIDVRTPAEFEEVRSLPKRCKLVHVGGV